MHVVVLLSYPATCDACDNIAMTFCYLWYMWQYCYDVPLPVIMWQYCYDVQLPVIHETVLLWCSATCDACGSIAMMFSYLWCMWQMFSYLWCMRQYCYDVQLHVMHEAVLLWCSATCDTCDRCSATCDACDGVSGDILLLDRRVATGQEVPALDRPVLTGREDQGRTGQWPTATGQTRLRERWIEIEIVERKKERWGEEERERDSFSRKAQFPTKKWRNLIKCNFFFSFFRCPTADIF